MIYNKTALVCDRCMKILKVRLSLDDIKYYEDGKLGEILCDNCYESDKQKY